jgi:hypothetical protein
MKNKLLISFTCSVLTLFLNAFAFADDAMPDEPNPARTHAIVKALTANPCQPVIDACTRAGYTGDVNSGKNLGRDCQWPLVNGSIKSLRGVRGLTADDLLNCKNRRQIQSENERKAYFSPLVAMNSKSSAFPDPGELE